jgi:predicted Abi (CAAX) family protease
MQKPNWNFRPEEWFVKTVEQYLTEHPDAKRTDAIHALVKRTSELEAKLKVAEADKKTWKQYADDMAEFARKQGWRQGKAPPKAPIE